MARLPFILLALVTLAGCNYHRSKLQPTDGPPVVTPEVPKTEVKVVHFSEIRERILVPLCLECHNSKLAKAGLDLSTHQGAMASVARGNAKESLLYNMVDWDEMPPRRRIPPLRLLTQEEKALVRTWIEDGSNP